MLIRSDPFTMLDRLLGQVQTGAATGATGARELPMPMDAYRSRDGYVVEFDVPGVDPGDIDVTVERNSLRVSASRKRTMPEGGEPVVCERPEQVSYSRHISLSEDLDSERIEASYDQGVLRLRIPVSERAQPRRIQVGGTTGTAAVGVGSSEQRERDVDVEATSGQRAATTGAERQEAATSGSAS